MELSEEFKKLTIANVANGAAAELFEHAVGEVLTNILDENRNPLESRKITLTFEVKSNRERNMATIGVQAKTSLAPIDAVDSTMFFRNEKGRPVAYSHNIFQPPMFDEKGNVAAIKGKSE